MPQLPLLFLTLFFCACSPLSAATLSRLLSATDHHHPHLKAYATSTAATSGGSGVSIRGENGSKGSALLIIDVQKCFLPGGVLPTLQGDSIIPNINLLKQQGHFSTVIITQDWHPQHHVSFASSWGKKPSETISLSYTAEGRLCNHTDKYPDHAVPCWSALAEPAVDSVKQPPSANTEQQQKLDTASACEAENSNGQGPCRQPMQAAAAAAAAAAPAHLLEQKLWPDHCIAGSEGAALHPDLHVQQGDYLIQKGHEQHIDAYSAFYDNGKFRSTGLSELLRSRGVHRVVVVGVALDYCVLWSARNAAEGGFEVLVVQDAVAPVSKDGERAAVQELQQAGVRLVKSTREYFQQVAEADVKQQPVEL